MSVNPKRRKIVDKDANCRLRHGLNGHCLAHIFQYLGSADLCIVGGMNKIYKQIINDFVISKHEVDFTELFQRGVTVSQVFRKYGTNIKKIKYITAYDHPRKQSIAQILKAITQYCLPDQLKSVKIWSGNAVNIPNQVRNVERFGFNGFNHGRLSVELSESLRYLSLAFVDLNPNFNWKNLINLTELRLRSVNGINVKNFIEFLHLRPKLQGFHHDRKTFGDSTQTVCEAIAKYCGNQIQEYYGAMPSDQRNMYSFISGFKNVKKVRLTSYQICCGDLMDAMKQLAENDTIEMLQIEFDYVPEHVNCIFQARPTHESIGVRQFSHLKTIRILSPYLGNNHFAEVCKPVELLKMFGPQIFSNIETLMVKTYSTEHIQDLIKFSPKLRHLQFDLNVSWREPAIEILSILEGLLQRRKNERIDDDFIEIEFADFSMFKLFTKINGRNGSIKLSWPIFRLRN